MGRGVAVIESIRGPNCDILWTYDRDHDTQTILDNLSESINSIFWGCTTNKDLGM